MLENLARYSRKKILVTGHTGFKGSWLTSILNLAGANVYGLSLPPDENSLYSRIGNAGMAGEVFLDLRNALEIQNYFEQNKFDGIFHLAAQPIVRYSYEFPVETFNTNVMGTAHLLNSVTIYKSSPWVIVVTTDKVYENSGSNIAYIENTKLGGSDPYSASKAAVEHIVSSWRNVALFLKSDLRLSTVRAGNVIGGGDFGSDRLLPDIVRSFSANKQLVIRNPSYVRPWQHVLDPLNGYLMLGLKMLNEEKVEYSYNFGPGEDSKRTVEEIVQFASLKWPGNPGYTFVDEQIHMKETPFLWLSSELARKDLGWRNIFEAQAAVSLTVDWEIQALSQPPIEVMQKQIIKFYEEWA